MILISLPFGFQTTSGAHKELEIETENLKQIKSELNSIKHNPPIYVEQSFERVFSQLDLRREKLKNEFEKLIDDYYKKIRRDLLNKNENIIQSLIFIRNRWF